MTETVLALIPAWGLWLVAGVTFLSCLALPVPASLVMLAAGAFAAAGDFALGHVMAAAFAGAVAGDQTGFLIGRTGGAALLSRVGHAPARAAALNQATAYLRRRGGVAVFLSRWLFSPLGPYVNFAGGAAGLSWGSFVLADLAGEAVWVALYTGLGFLFADRVADLAALLGNLSGALAAGVVALFLGLRLRKVLRRR